MRESYAIGITLYNPEKILFNRVEAMTSIGFKVYIFDNSPFIIEKGKNLPKITNVTYITAGKNVGIGYSLSTICATAYAHGFQNCLFLDQDTVISNRTLQYIEEYYKLMSNEKNKYAALVFSGESHNNYSVQDVRLAINSGSLFNLSILKQLGWHSEKYFVDCVDYEFCIRARRSGYKIGIVKNTPDFDHMTEQPDRQLNFFGKKVLVRRYAIVRIRDTISAYIKLIFFGFFKNDGIDTIVLIKSAAIYVFNQIIARLIRLK